MSKFDLDDEIPDYEPYLTKLWPYIIMLVIVSAGSIYFGWRAASS
jgi:hypothetical protein